MIVRRTPALAGADVPHGAYCRLEKGQAFPQLSADGTGGISAGPATPLGYTPAGAPVQIQTEGGVMTEAGWVELRGGRVVE
jgi:hypothetical protein